MEQVSEVKAFIGFYAINTLFEPVDVECSDGRRVVACRWVCPGMGPNIDGPTPAFVAPSMVYVLFCGHVEDGEKFFLGVAEVNLVHLWDHEVSPPFSENSNASSHFGHTATAAR